MELHRDMAEVELTSSKSSFGNEIFSKIGCFEDSAQEGLSDAFASLQQDTLRVGVRYDE